MKNILGGDYGGGGGGAGYKCCYTNPTGCSVCDPKATSSATCINNGHSDGTLTAC